MDKNFELPMYKGKTKQEKEAMYLKMYRALSPSTRTKLSAKSKIKQERCTLVFLKSLFGTEHKEILKKVGVTSKRNGLLDICVELNIYKLLMSAILLSTTDKTSLRFITDLAAMMVDRGICTEDEYRQWGIFPKEPNSIDGLPDRINFNIKPKNFTYQFYQIIGTGRMYP